MATIIDDDYHVCSDCYPVIVNGDYSHLDYYYKQKDVANRMEEINQGIANAGGHIYAGDSDKDDEFATRPCDCCGSKFHGARFHCVILS